MVIACFSKPTQINGPPSQNRLRNHLGFVQLAGEYTHDFEGIAGAIADLHDHRTALVRQLDVLCRSALDAFHASDRLHGFAENPPDYRGNLYRGAAGASCPLTNLIGDIRSGSN